MSQPKVFIAAPFPALLLEPFVTQWAAQHRAEPAVWTPEAIIAAALEEQPEVLVIIGTSPMTAATIAALPASVKVLATLSVGVNHIDLKAAEARGLLVLNTPAVLNDSVADIALFLMLGAARRATEGIEMLRRGQWTGWNPGQLLGRDIYGQRLGIFGMGGIGRAIAKRALGFGMVIQYHNRTRLSADLEHGALYHPSVQALFAASDVICIASPATPETRHVVNATSLAWLPRGAIVVNISRGDTVDDEALIAALASGQVSAAGLDVFNGEPNLHPAYQSLPNVFALPHLGSATTGTRLAMAQALCDGIAAYSTGQPPKNRVV